MYVVLINNLNEKHWRIFDKFRTNQAFSELIIQISYIEILTTKKIN